MDGTVISPDRRKPKKQVQHAAHNIILSALCLSFSQNFLKCFKMLGVMGSLDLERVATLFACLSLMPFKVHSNRGQEATKGSPNPCTICSRRMADKYPLIEVCLRPSSAKCATNKHK